MPLRNENPGSSTSYPAVQDVLVRTGVSFQRADVLPVAVASRTRTATAAPGQQRGKTSAEKSTTPSLDEIEDPRLENVDARIDGVGKNLAPRGLFQEALDRPSGRVTTMPNSRGLGTEQQRLWSPKPFFSWWKFDDRAQVDIREHVAGNDQERLVQLLHGVADRTGRPQRRILTGVDDPGAELGTVAEVVLYGVGLVSRP